MQGWVQVSARRPGRMTAASLLLPAFASWRFPPCETARSFACDMPWIRANLQDARIIGNASQGMMCRGRMFGQFSVRIALMNVPSENPTNNPQQGTFLDFPPAEKALSLRLGVSARVFCAVGNKALAWPPHEDRSRQARTETDEQT
jgi:hypothetical protein